VGGAGQVGVRAHASIGMRRRKSSAHWIGPARRPGSWQRPLLGARLGSRLEGEAISLGGRGGPPDRHTGSLACRITRSGPRNQLASLQRSPGRRGPRTRAAPCRRPRRTPPGRLAIVCRRWPVRSRRSAQSHCRQGQGGAPRHGAPRAKAWWLKLIVAGKTEVCPHAEGWGGVTASPVRPPHLQGDGIGGFRALGFARLRSGGAVLPVEPRGTITALQVVR